MTQQNNLLKSALWYAVHGWYVMPLHEPLFSDGDCIGCSCEAWKREHYEPDYICKSPGKHPRHNEWESIATTDQTQINKWWRAWPQANVGIAPGPSGLVVLDGDTYKEHGGDTLSFETVTTLTGGGGEHWFFKHPDTDLKLGNSTGDLPRWVDVRGWGGMVVAPPSVHPSGNVYEFEDGYGPHEIDPAPLPDDVASELIKAAETAVSIAPLEDCNDPNIEQYAHKLPGLLMAVLRDDRSSIDFWIIRSFIRSGMPDDEIYGYFAYHDPTGKYTEKNGQGGKYLGHTIAKAKKHIEYVTTRQHQPQEDAP